MLLWDTGTVLLLGPAIVVTGKQPGGLELCTLSLAHKYAQGVTCLPPCDAVSMYVTLLHRGTYTLHCYTDEALAEDTFLLELLLR